MTKSIGAHGTILDRFVWMNEIKNLFNLHNLNLHMLVDVAMCNWLYCNAL
jgi:hypothetical protein